MRTTLASLALLAALATSDAAWATPTFPGVMQSHLGASALPECAVCHLDAKTGRGTVNTAFGRAMRDRGLVLYDEQSLRTALDRMAADKVDSDGDKAIDVDELRQGKSPNPTVEEAEDLGVEAPPRFGCGARVASSAPPGPTAAALLLAGAVIALRARRRSRRGA